MQAYVLVSFFPKHIIAFYCCFSHSMEFHLLPVFAFISLALAVSHAAPTSEVYWQSVLPNTPMPKAVRDLLPPVNADIGNEKPSSVSFGDEAVSVGVGVGVGVGGGGGGGGVSVGTGHKGNPYVRVHPPHDSYKPWGPFLYNYAASEDQLRDNPNVAIFFLEKNLHAGTKFNLHFTKTLAGGKFLPRQTAETIPFSSNKFSEILKRFSVKPESVEAEVLKRTIKECEEPAMEGEDKYCATSLEAMVDFSTSKLGKNVQVMSTEVSKEETKQQEFTISRGVQKMVGNETVVCHGQKYVYPVFYCHAMHTTRAYLVPLVGTDGTKAKAVSVCHTDTSKWNPKHLAFQVLKVKPGTTPICHFLPEDHIVWTSK